MKKHSHTVQFPDPGHDHRPCLADTLRRAETVYEELGMRLTPLRKQVLNEIAGSHTAVGAYDVLDRLSRQSGRRLAPISVYRALDSLVETGLVHRLESRNAFFACHSRHAANLRQIILACERCNTVAEISGETVFDEIAQLAKTAGFSATRTLVEISGQCGRCSKAPD
jgi:Fur family transcriptional regulator, zinc uptake regulator